MMYELALGAIVMPKGFTLFIFGFIGSVVAIALFRPKD